MSDFVYSFRGLLAAAALTGFADAIASMHASTDPVFRDHPMRNFGSCNSGVSDPKDGYVANW